MHATLRDLRAELPTGRMDLRVGSGRVKILPEFDGSGRVSTLDLLVFTDYFLVPENTTFGLFDFHRYLIYNNYSIDKIIIKLKTIHIR